MVLSRTITQLPPGYKEDHPSLQERSAQLAPLSMARTSPHPTPRLRSRYPAAETTPSIALWVLGATDSLPWPRLFCQKAQEQFRWAT